jgi:Ran GTPase-activating protein (RanGAP) involved in mRNA processing and transport
MSITKEGRWAMGEALAVNTTLTQLNLGSNLLGKEGGRAIGEALAVNTTLTQLDLSGNKIGCTGGHLPYLRLWKATRLSPILI